MLICLNMSVVTWCFHGRIKRKIFNTYVHTSTWLSFLVLYGFTTFSTHFRFACDCSAGAWMLTVMTCHSWCRRCLYASAWPTFFSHFCPFTKFCTSIMCDAMRLAGNERALGSAVRGMVCAFDTSSAPCFCCGLSLSRVWVKSGRPHGLAIIP